MSATGSKFRFDDPFRTGQAGTYDMGTMSGLILRAQQGDMVAKNHLKLSGFGDEWGNLPQNVQLGDYKGAINTWATEKGLTPYTAGPAFDFKPSYASGDPTFSTAWDSMFGMQPAQARVDTSGNPAPGVDGKKILETPVTTALQPGAQGAAQPGQLPGGGGATTWTQQPEWMDGAYNLGSTFANGRWTPNNQTFAKGHVVGSEVGWQSGMALPVGYNASQDTYRGGLGGQEMAIHKAMRIANDLVKNGQAKSPQRALEYGMAFVQAEARRAGQQTGWDMSTLTDQLGGYNEATNYYAAGKDGTAPPPGQPAPAAGQPTPPPLAGQEVVDPAKPPTPQTPAEKAAAKQAAAEVAAAGGDNSGMQNIVYAGNPKAQRDLLYQSLGIDPTRDNDYVNSIIEALNPALSAMVSVDKFGTGESADDNIQNRIRQLAGFFKGGGGGYGAMRNEFRGALGRSNAQQTLDDLGDTEARNMMQTMMYGANAGGNRYTSQALANRFRRAYGDDRSGGAYDRYVLQNLGKPTMKPREWLLQSEWADLLNGL